MYNEKALGGCTYHISNIFCVPLVINSFKLRPDFLHYSFLALTMTQSDIPAVAELFLSSCGCEL